MKKVGITIFYEYFMYFCRKIVYQKEKSYIKEEKRQKERTIETNNGHLAGGHQLYHNILNIF